MSRQLIYIGKKDHGLDSNEHIKTKKQKAQKKDINYLKKQPVVLHTRKNVLSMQNNLTSTFSGSGYTSSTTIGSNTYIDPNNKTIADSCNKSLQFKNINNLTY
tara:strand:- start:2896 stop:3204 length:309 start_codon:yes stop_codon:yes gene_type:complete